MAEIVYSATDDGYDLWVCPTHGVIDEGELLEGVDWNNPNPDGDIYTDEFFCGRDHAEDQAHRAVLVNVRADVTSALRQEAGPHE